MGVQRVVDFRHGPRDLPLADEELSTNLAALARAIVTKLRLAQRPICTANGTGCST